MAALTPCNDLALTTTTTEPRVDTRLLARQLDNRHKAVMTLIERYADSFKAHGQLAFKKTVGKRKQGGGNAERYALLTIGQLVASKAATGATDHHAGYQHIKTALLALGALTQLEAPDRKCFAGGQHG